MNYQELKSKRLWKKVDFDGVYWNQCVDFARQAVKDLFWVTIGTFSGSALNGWNTWSPFDSNWIKVKNTDNAVPPAGAVVFFDKMYKNWKCVNEYWHVAIAWEKSCITKLVVLEQNAWSWNGDWKWNNAITERLLDYINPAKCLGWYIFNWITDKNMWIYEKIFNETYKTSSVYSDIQGALKNLGIEWDTKSKETFYFNLIWFERIAKGEINK